MIVFKGQKKDVPDKDLSHQTNTQSVKVMVSTALTWFGVTKPLFVNKKRLKANAKITVNILKKNCFLPFIRSIHEKIGFSFKMVQRPIPVISFKMFWKKPYCDVTKKISGLQNHQTAILWIITSGIRLRWKYMKTD